MTLNDLKIKIEELNNYFPNINYGGCGTFSYHLNKVLKDKYAIESNLYYLPGIPAAIEYDLHFSHIVIKIDNYIIDNNGFYENGNGWTKDLKALSDEKLKEMIDIPLLWNNMFYTDNNIKELVERIYEI